MQNDILLRNDRLLQVARRGKVDRPPVWLMRQAGRFLKEYRAVRAKAGSFQAMIAHPEIAAEVTLQPVELVGVDAAIIFSDILVIPEAMGLPYEMVPNKGPFFPETVRNMKAFSKLRPIAEESNLNHTYQAISIVKQELKGKVPLIGFAGAPWTIFSYMTEGSGSKTFSKAKSLLYTAPEFSHKLLQAITDATITYLKGQIQAGADIVQLFDSWAGVLNKQLYTEFGLPYLRQICDAIQEVPKTVFAKGAFFALAEITTLDCHIIGVDWQTEPQFAQKFIQSQAFQGNLDPCLLYADRGTIIRETKKMIQAFPEGRYIANLGHGIYPDTPRDNVICFIDTVKSFAYPRNNAY